VSDFHFAELVRSHFDCTIALINDIDAQAVGEQKLGAGKGIDHLVYLYVGHGIGAGIIINGQLYTGSNHLAAEIGHMSINYDGQLCKCEHGIGCLESLSSKLAIVQAIQSAYQHGEQTTLAEHLSKDPLDLSAAKLADAIEQQDPLTMRIVTEAAEAFGAGIANVVNFLNPHVIVLGGDVVDEIDLFCDLAIASARRRSLPSSLQDMSIVRGGLGTTAGAYGAAVFAKQYIAQMRQRAE
ncbi:MAG: ROK family protein, partial [Chloroflexi bacterium]